MADRRSDSWTLYATARGRTHPPAKVYSSRERALDAAQRLWKQGLAPAYISGPAGEHISAEEIEKYGAEHINSAD